MLTHIKAKLQNVQWLCFLRDLNIDYSWIMLCSVPEYRSYAKLYNCRGASTLKQTSGTEHRARMENNTNHSFQQVWSFVGTSVTHAKSHVVACLSTRVPIRGSVDSGRGQPKSPICVKHMWSKCDLTSFVIFAFTSHCLRGCFKHLLLIWIWPCSSAYAHMLHIIDTTQLVFMKSYGCAIICW